MIFQTQTIISFGETITRQLPWNLRLLN